MTQPNASLPRRPSLALLSNLAKALQKAHDAHVPEAIARIKARHPRFGSATDEQIAQTPLALRDAQLVIAREYGFEHWAAMKQHIASLQLVPDLDAPARQLIDAAGKGDAHAVARILDEHPDALNQLSGDDRKHNVFKTTALHRAADKGHLEIVRLLLDRGADPDIRDEGDNAMAMHFAAESGHLDVIKLLVERGADVNGFGDVHGWDIIGWATLHHKTHADVANYLLANGAQHNIFSAVAMGDVEAIRNLAPIRRDVIDKPMAIWEARRRPLHLAVMKHQPTVIPVLLDLGADIEATDVDQLTPLDYATLRNEKACAEILLSRGARINLPAAFALGRDDIIEAEMKRDSDALKPSHRFAKLIEMACEVSSGETIERLIAHGAVVKSSSESASFGTKGYTPLHSAAWHGNLEAIRVLVKHGAELDPRDSTHSATPLGWANYAGRTEAAKLLESLGAKE
ncbi:MAG TPA: ankyrin repeat domain-containing protein [Tepidisphaeraceae bacterium]|nr:ankyrin repeat domain-containing protein [Tepidisphaeraceae bacterium]